MQRQDRISTHLQHPAGLLAGRTLSALLLCLSGWMLLPTPARAGGITAVYVSADLATVPSDPTLWSKAPETVVPLLAQPMIVPRPKITTTHEVKVQAIHDGRWIAFRLSWVDSERSEGGALGKYSDACAIEFPGKPGPVPPPIFMGMKDNPVHILHWRAQYQVDREQGLKTTKDYYPNMQIDMYPMEYNDMGMISSVNNGDREVYSPGLAAGNPQSYRKLRGVDEIIAEGFGSSTIAQNAMALGAGEWKDGRWTVVITRPLARENGSVLLEGSDTWLGFAIWQGGKDEVGSRKSVTMSWTPMHIDLGTGSDKLTGNSAQNELPKTATPGKE